MLESGLPEGIVEGEAVDDVFVSLETQELLSCFGVPDFTSPVVTSRDESGFK